MSGSYEQLFDYSLFSASSFTQLPRLALFSLRWKQPDTPRPYRVAGYPWVPAVFLVAMTGLILNTLWERPVQSLLGVGMVALGCTVLHVAPGDARRRNTVTGANVHTTLPRRFYADPDSIARELERFYFNRWICAGRADQIPNAGDYFTRTLGDESVIVTRDGSGEIHALFNVCRHRGTRLCDQTEGHFADRIQCPYHNWTYDLDGRLLAAPHMPPGFSKDDYPLHRAGCEVWDGHIFVHLGQVAGQAQVGQDGLIAGHAPALRDQLADLPERFAAWQMADLRLGRRIVYDVKANWKLIVLNYNECLHCPNLHPALNKLHHYLGADNVAPTACYCGGAMGFRDGVETMSMDGKRRRAYLPGPERGAAAAGRLLRDLSEPPAQPASRLRDDAHALAARARPHRDRLRVAFPSRPSSHARTCRSTMRWSSGT